ncbi:MAG: hypothetical protein JW735_00930, partial [Prolixibacteraceae bacterium]|nr:hypothetical protein [Prolixibacteraceae bacterium]
TEIVKSISVIPDNITRSVYIKECSNMLDVDEDILYSEVRKIKFKLTEDQIIAEKREQNRQASQTQNIQSPKPAVSDNPCKIEEKALMRILLRYFNLDLFKIEVETEHGDEERMVKVGEYILAELEADNLSSVDPVYQQIFDEFKEHQYEDFFNPERYFVHHENSEISKTVSGLLVDKHIESMIWKRKGAYVENEDEVLHTIVPRLIEEYKMRRVKLMIAELMQKINLLKHNDDLEKILELQTLITNLKRVEKDLSLKLGKRAITS